MNKNIALIMDNSSAFVKSLLKIWNEGNCAVLINYKMPIVRIKEIIKTCKIDECYIDENDYESFSNIECEKHICRTNNNYELLSSEIIDQFKENYKNSNAIILYSSGTTGNSKGIVLTHRAINLNADYIIKMHNDNIINNMAIVKGLAHSSALIAELLVGLKLKRKIIIFSTKIAFNYVCRKIDELHIKTLFLNPTLLYSFFKYLEHNISECKSINTIYVSGSLINNATLDKIKQYKNNYKIFNCYGLTECAPRLTMQTFNNNQLGSSGIPIGKVKIKILNNDEHKCSINQPGKIYVKTPCLFKKYIGKRKVYKRCKWFATNDYGYIDENGELFVLGRLDEMIITASHNVFPRDIEKLINKLSFINDCLVTSINCELTVQKIVCLYTLKYEVEDAVKKIKNICNNNLLNHEIPKIFIKLNNIPKNQNGKIDFDKVKKIIKGVVNNE